MYTLVRFLEKSLKKSKSAVRQKMYASQECIYNEHRLTRLADNLADNNRTLKEHKTNIDEQHSFVVRKVDPAKCDRAITVQ